MIDPSTDDTDINEEGTGFADWKIGLYIGIAVVIMAVIVGVIVCFVRKSRNNQTFEYRK